VVEYWDFKKCGPKTKREETSSMRGNAASVPKKKSFKEKGCDKFGQLKQPLVLHISQKEEKRPHKRIEGKKPSHLRKQEDALGHKGKSHLPPNLRVPK